MAKEADYVDVGGDFVVDGNYSYLNTNSFTAGTLELKGNFSQLSTGDSSLNQYNFHTSGSHKVILSGTEEQTITFEDPSSRYSHFATIEINNSKGSIFTTPIVTTVLFNHKRKLVELKFLDQSAFPDYDKDGMKDHLDPYPTDPDNNVSDRDNDGIEDENDAFPDDPNESVDTDNDGTGNNADTDDDDDGLPDTWEVANGLDPLDASDADIDTDNDGASNLEEFAASTDPQDANSKPLAISAHAGADLTLNINDSIEISGSGIGTNNSLITGFEWKEGTTILASTAAFTYTPTTDGVHTLTLLVTDGSGATASDSVVVTVNDPNSVDLQEGLVGHYEFEGNINDSSGNAYHGIEHGGLTYIDGVIKKSIKFTNYMDLVELPKENLNGSTVSTTSIWIRFAGVDTDVGVLASYGQNIANQYLLFIGDSGKGIVNFILHNDSYLGQREINDRQYHLVSIVRTSTHIKYYIDGELDSAFEKPVDQLTVDGSIWLGNDLDCLDGCWDATQQFKGELDDLRIYNRALNEAEIQTLYQLGENVTLNKVITGNVSSDEGEAVPNINVKLEYLVDGEEQSATATTDASGNYEIKINKSYFDEASESTYLIYAYKEGYHPDTNTLQIGSSDSYSVDFVLNPIQVNEVVLEIEPQVIT